MIDEIRLKRFTSDLNCYKVESSPCPALKEVAEELRIAQEKIARRNMQIKDLRAEVSLLLLREKSLEEVIWKQNKEALKI